MRTFHFSNSFSAFVLDEFQFGTSTLKLDFSLNLKEMPQQELDVCMSRILAVVDNIFDDGIICVDDNVSGEIISSAISNFCVQLPGELNYEILSELLCHKIHSVTDNKVEVTRVVICPNDHHFGIEFNQTSPKQFVEGFDERWWFNPNLKFSDYEEEDLNAEVMWAELGLDWPTAPKKKKPAKETTKRTDSNVIIEFPTAGK